MINNQEFKLINTKFSKLFENVDTHLSEYSYDFCRHFFSSVFQRFSETVNHIMNEKYKKYTETCQIYQTQIKEMEFLINEDDQHQDSIMLIVDSLKEEKQQELQRMEDHYQNLIEEAIANFKSFGIKNNSGIELQEEKMKLEMFNMINDAIIPGKR